MKRAANSHPYSAHHNATSTRYVEDRIRRAAQNFAANKARQQAKSEAVDAAIEALITNYPDCPRWASRAVDQLMAQQEFLAQSSQEQF